MKLIISKLLVITIAIFLALSCNSNNTKYAYACPMQCQKDTAYLNSGSCPVCRMEMEKNNQFDSTKTTILTNSK